MTVALPERLSGWPALNGAPAARALRGPARKTPTALQAPSHQHGTPPQAAGVSQHSHLRGPQPRTPARNGNAMRRSLGQHAPGEHFSLCGDLDGTAPKDIYSDRLRVGRKRVGWRGRAQVCDGWIWASLPPLCSWASCWMFFGSAGAVIERLRTVNFSLSLRTISHRQQKNEGTRRSSFGPTQSPARADVSACGLVFGMPGSDVSALHAHACACQCLPRPAHRLRSRPAVFA